MTACPDCHGKGASTHDINGNTVYYCNCPDELDGHIPSTMERLLQASIDLIEKDQRIHELENENTLLRAQLRMAQLRAERRLVASSTESMFHRRQAE